MAPVSQGVFMTLIPRTDLDVFPLNLGGNTFGWTSDRETSFAVLDAYVSAGGNFIDTADGYSALVGWHNGCESESGQGQWVAERGYRDQLVIANKASTKPDRKGLEAANVEAALAESLQRLQNNVIDLNFLPFDDEAGAIPDKVRP